MQCGLYVSVHAGGTIKRDLATKSSELKQMKKTTINEEIIAFSELNFTNYAKIIELIENLSEESYVEETEGDYENAGVSVEMYKKILQTVHELLEALEEENPIHGTLLRALLEDQLPPDDGSAIYLLNCEAKITACLSSVMKLQFLINDILDDLRNGIPLDMEQKYHIFRAVAFTQIQTLDKNISTCSHFRSPIDYYVFLMMQFIASSPRVAFCHCCGRYFIPKTKHTTLYCDRIIRKGKTCKQIAPALKHKRDAAKDSVIETFDRTKKKMYKRFERATDAAHPLAHGLDFAQYYDWLKKAEQARNHYLADKLSAEEALRIITAE